MKTRRLGSSDILVSEIALGSWLNYAGGVVRERSEACIRAAFDAGINFFDTANEYGKGGAESLIGETLRAFPRDSFVLATKLFFPMTEADRGLSAAQVAKQLDLSLRRLQTEYVDLYQCHRWDSETPLDETMEALTRAVASGKVRAIGFSGWTAAQVEQAAGLSRERGYAAFVSSQPQYSMLWRKPEADVFPACAKHGIGQIVFSPLAQGVLTGKYKPGAPPPADSRAANDGINMFMETNGRRFRSDDLLAAVQRLAPIAEELGTTMANLALAWVLRRSEIAAAIIGASRPEQIVENAKASELILPDEVLRRIDVALCEVVVG
jgi:aryl-alcohol dehydrogenase-like predicted oxidoreductase